MAGLQATPSSSSAATSPADGPRLFSRQELEDLITQKFKAFVKEPCGQCGAAACKRFSSSMPFVVKTMLDTFWCKDCSRLLCETHRSQHTCERYDEKKSRLQKMTPEQIKEQLEAEARRKLQAEEAAKAAQRAVAVAAEEKRLQMKAKRKLIAGKAMQVASFLQSAAREGSDARPKSVVDELLELYTKANRISLHLWNEYESPSVSGLDEEDWAAMKEIYARAKELLHMFIVVDGQPLDMTNPWEEGAGPGSGAAEL